ncbi:hypothetical protein ALC57_12149 [Trachymyrmex cornetzi]|uniref:Uncharacterized protein n=1 Tax=Trachymyrmex cornetzi TaxID=471704 RepID=A0A195DS21_9HYME|nr:hypothetical protein ALC57_12149 [Trachymyrmex cornetzi]
MDTATRRDAELLRDMISFTVENTYSLAVVDDETTTTTRAVEGSFYLGRISRKEKPGVGSLLRLASTRHLSARQASEERSTPNSECEQFRAAAAARSPRGWEGNVRNRRAGRISRTELIASVAENDRHAGQAAGENWERQSQRRQTHHETHTERGSRVLRAAMRPERLLVSGTTASEHETATAAAGSAAPSRVQPKIWVDDETQ